MTDDLNLKSMGVVFQNAVVLTESQFEMILNKLNTMHHEIEGLRRAVGKPAENITPNLTPLLLEVVGEGNKPRMLPNDEPIILEKKYILDDIKKMYPEIARNTSTGKYTVKVHDNAAAKGTRPITGNSLDEIYAKLLKFYNGELPKRKYKKRNTSSLRTKRQVAPTITEENFREWKVVQENLLLRSSLISFDSIYDYMRKNYGIVWEQEFKEKGHNKRTILNLIYGDAMLKSIFEASLQDSVHNNPFNPELMGQNLANVSKGQYSCRSIYNTMKSIFKATIPNGVDKKKAVMQDAKLKTAFIASYDRLMAKCK